MKHPESIDATPLERLVQPYLDDELAPEEVVAFERRLDDDPGLRDLVHEQAEVRDALRSLPRDAAPPSLRARILLELDAVDREPTVVPLSRRLARRSGALLRGALVMIPASAAALALFFLARQEPPAEAPAQALVAPLDAETPTRLVELDARPIPVQLTPAGRGDQRINLVGLEVADPEQGPQRRWTARAMYEAGPGGPRILDQQRRAPGLAPQGERQLYRGTAFHWSRSRSGAPVVQFLVGDTLHELSWVGQTASARPDLLLELGHQLVRAEPR